MAAAKLSESPASNDPDDIEATLLRTLSANGLFFDTDLSAEQRRQAIRIAILKQKLNGEVFNAWLTFDQAYQRCYGLPLEMRRARGASTASASVSKDEESVNE